MKEEIAPQDTQRLQEEARSISAAIPIAPAQRPYAPQLTSKLFSNHQNSMPGVLHCGQSNTAAIAPQASEKNLCSSWMRTGHQKCLQCCLRVKGLQS
jgi:hypothetical protein